MNRSGLLRRIELLVVSCWLVASHAATFQTISVANSQWPVGEGDSVAPIVSVDGHYVVFESEAHNLLLTTNGAPVPAFPIPKLNVYVRDRSNAVTRLVSADLSGISGGSEDSVATGISTNNRYIVFESRATNLVANCTNGSSQIFVRDLISNITALVSVNTNGLAGNGACRGSTMTPDGRFVAFVSAASDLVLGDTNGITDVFLRDLQTGTTTLISQGAMGRGVSNPSSEAPEITSDGRFIAFFSSATNLLPGLTVNGDIYVRDVVSGTTTWASAGALAAVLSAFGPTNAVSYNHAISADGHYVIFESSPSPNSAGTNAAGVILRYDLQSGTTEVVNTNAFVAASPYEFIRTLDMTADGRFAAFVANTNGTSGTDTCIDLWDGLTGITTLLSGDTNNSVPAGSICQWPAFDSSGRFLTFSSTATHLTTNGLVGEYHLYVRDLETGTTALIDGDTNGVGSAVGPDSIVSPSAGARVIAFEAQDGKLTPGDRNKGPDIFALDWNAGQTELISARNPALASSTSAGFSIHGATSLTTDGSRIAFSSDAPDLVPEDTNGVRDVFVRDLPSGTTILVSVSASGLLGNGNSLDASISGDGRYVAFTSWADNLIGNDINNTSDIFVKDLLTGAIQLISVNTNGSVGNGVSSSPVVSLDGTRVLFLSQATDLGPSVQVGPNFYVRDLNSGVTYALTTRGWGGPANPAASRGRYILYAGNAPNAGLFLWDSVVHAIVYTNAVTSSSFSRPAVSPNGNRIAYYYQSQFRAEDRSANRSWFNSGSSSPYPPQFSDDGRFVVYTGASTFNQVYVLDLQEGTTTLVSKAFGSVFLAGNGNSDSPVISGDGRFIAFRSTATNLDPFDNHFSTGVFLYDRLNGVTTLLSASSFGNGSADNLSLAPAFSGDSRTVVFRSWADDLVPNDFNQDADIFAMNLYPSNSIAPFRVDFLPVAGANQILTWLVTPGRTYTILSKTNLVDPLWQTITGQMTLIGNRAYFSNSTAVAPQRFYRVMAN